MLWVSIFLFLAYPGPLVEVLFDFDFEFFEFELVILIIVAGPLIRNVPFLLFYSLP